MGVAARTVAFLDLSFLLCTVIVDDLLSLTKSGLKVAVRVSEEL